MTSKQGNRWPILSLFFLAPTIGELLSGSSPPVEFFNPIILLLLAALYSSGAILIRELRVRWGKGWPTVLALGAAYGVVEEGLMVKSFFDPGWEDLGTLGVYGRWAGVNWVWSLQLTLYHAVFSIAIPILLVELLFPARRGERWLGRRGMNVLSLLVMADGLFIFFLLTPYRPPSIPYLAAVVVVVALFLVAQRLPPGAPTQCSAQVPRPLRFALLGFAATYAFFFIQWWLPESAVPAPLALLSIIALAVLAAWGVRRMSRGGAWSDVHRLALAGGALAFFVLLAPLQELDPERMDNPVGMTAVGLLTLAFLSWLWRRVHSRHTIHVEARIDDSNLPLGERVRFQRLIGAPASSVLIVDEDLERLYNLIDSGASNMPHLEQAVAALEIHLSPEERAYLEEPYQPHPVLGH